MAGVVEAMNVSKGDGFNKVKVIDALSTHPFWLPGAPCRSTMTLRPWLRAQPTAFWRYGSCPEMYGSPGPTSKAQYPMGNRTWLRLRIADAFHDRSGGHRLG